MITTERYSVHEHIDYSKCRDIARETFRKLAEHFNTNFSVKFSERESCKSYYNVNKRQITFNLYSIHYAYYHSFLPMPSLKKFYKSEHKEYEVVVCLCAHEFAHVLQYDEYPESKQHSREYQQFLAQVTQFLSL